MVDIDFVIMIPSSGYFVAINMLVEFSNAGQVIPTRLDSMPYKLGPFASWNKGNGKIISSLKFLLVIYTASIVIQNFA